MNIDKGIQVSIIESNFAKLGIELPASVAAAGARQERIEAAMASAQSDAGDLLAGAIEALDHGKALNTPRVLRALAAERLQTLDGPIRAQLTTERMAAIRSAVPQLLESLRGAIEDDAKNVVAMREQLGDIDLTDTAAILARGAQAAANWTTTQSALARIKDASGAWSTLAVSTGFGALSPLHRPLHLAVFTLAELEPLDHDTAHDAAALAWRLAGQGRVVDLATVDTLRERLDAIADERRQRASEIEDFKLGGPRTPYAAAGW